METHREDGHVELEAGLGCTVTTSGMTGTTRTVRGKKDSLPEPSEGA